MAYESRKYELQAAIETKGFDAPTKDKLRALIDFAAPRLRTRLQQADELMSGTAPTSPNPSVLAIADEISAQRKGA